MFTVISIGGIAMSGAAACYVLDQLGQKYVTMAMSVLVSLFLILTLSELMMTTARSIINMFGGLPL